jgi:hypothetical protein
VSVDKPRQLKVRRLPPQERLITEGSLGTARPLAGLRFSSDSSEAPILLLRTGERDLEPVLKGIERGARPSAVVTGFGEKPEITTRARRRLAELGVAWAPDSLLFRTALPGYKTATYLKDLDYAPGRDEDPYSAAEFADRELLNHVGRNVVGRAHGHEANAVWAGGFYVSGPDDPWLRVNRDLLRVGIAARDSWSDLPLLAPVIVRLSAFLELEDQLSLIRAMIARRPEAYIVMLDGLERDSGHDRLVCALRLMLLLQAAGVDTIHGRSGDLRRLSWAFGVRGAESGLGRLMRFALRDYMNDQNRNRPGPLAPRFEFDSLLTSLPATEAIQVIGSELVPEAECECGGGCDAGDGSARSRVAQAVGHNGNCLIDGAESLRGVAPERRVAILLEDIRAAEYRWEDLRRDKVKVNPAPHLTRWRKAIDLAVSWGLLEPRELADRHGLLD